VNAYSEQVLSVSDPPGRRSCSVGADNPQCKTEVEEIFAQSTSVGTTDVERWPNRSPDWILEDREAKSGILIARHELEVNLLLLECGVVEPVH